MNHRRATPPPRGSMLFELIASAALLGAVLVMITRVSAATDAQQRLAGQREAASFALQNAMETLATLRPEDRAACVDAPPPLSERATLRLPDAELTAEVAPLEPIGDTAPQRVTLRVSWTPTPGARPASLALTACFYDPPFEPQP